MGNKGSEIGDAGVPVPCCERTRERANEYKGAGWELDGNGRERGGEGGKVGGWVGRWAEVYGETGVEDGVGNAIPCGDRPVITNCPWREDAQN